MIKKYLNFHQDLNSDSFSSDPEIISDFYSDKISIESGSDAMNENPDE